MKFVDINLMGVGYGPLDISTDFGTY